MRLPLATQTCGSIVVFGAFGASEAAARFLDACPGSALAWYLNLELFRPFEAARAAASPLRYLFGPSALTLDLSLLVLILAMGAMRYRFGVAVFANLAFVAAAMLSYVWLCVPATPLSAAIMPIDVSRHLTTSDPDLLILGLLSASFAAFAYSHVGFVIAIRRSA